MTNPKRKMDCGYIKVEKIIHKKVFGISDLLRKRLHIRLTSCIDYSSGNGCLDDLDCLHTVRSGKKNPYLESISSIYQTVKNFSKDKSIKTFGFGAKFDDEKYSQLVN